MTKGTWYWRCEHIPKGDYGTLPYRLTKSTRAEHFHQYVKLCNKCYDILNEGLTLEVERGSQRKDVSIGDLDE